MIIRTGNGRSGIDVQVVGNVESTRLAHGAVRASGPFPPIDIVGGWTF